MGYFYGDSITDLKSHYECCLKNKMLLKGAQEVILGLWAVSPIFFAPQPLKSASALQEAHL